jgi:hypothetical protein
MRCGAGEAPTDSTPWQGNTPTTCSSAKSAQLHAWSCLLQAREGRGHQCVVVSRTYPALKLGEHTRALHSDFRWPSGAICAAIRARCVRALLTEGLTIPRVSSRLTSATI